MNPNALVQISTHTQGAVKGCKYIYAPAGQAGEYAPLASNPYRGCGHGCAYCYVPQVLKMKRHEFDAGANARPDYLANLRKDARKYEAAGITEQVFFSFTTDVYSPFDRSLTRPSLQIIQEHGMGICVLTKGGTRALADIDLYRPDRDCFASTLTSLDEAFSRKWERNAALPNDRIATLKAFHDRGIYTWVSLEPTLDVESSLAIVEATHGFVGLYKIGRANYLKAITRTTDWRDYTLQMIDLCQRLGVAHYIKRDLQPYLPAGYHNPLRVEQHHGQTTPQTTSSKTLTVTSNATNVVTAPIEYVPGFVPDTREMYDTLMTLPWRRRQAPFGHMVPRDEVWISPYSYSYGGRTYEAFDGWTPELLKIKALVEAHTGVEFNSVLCNLYKNGHDWVVYHCDCEETMSTDHPIASISLGSERLFQMRRKNDHQTKEQLILGDGSLVVMKAGMQQEWEHQIPKCAEHTGSRINLTFRVMTGDDKPRVTTMTMPVIYEEPKAITVKLPVTYEEPKAITVKLPVTYDDLVLPLLPSEKSSLETPTTDGEFASNEASLNADAKKTLADFRAAHEQAFGKADEFVAKYDSAVRWFAEEVVPAVEIVRAYLSIRGSMHVPGIGLPQWSEWRDAFLQRLRTKMKVSKATLERALKKFRKLDDVAPSQRLTDAAADDSDELDDAPELADPVGVPAPGTFGSPKELLTARLKEMKAALSKGLAPVDPDPVRDAERRACRVLEFIEATELAIDDGLLAMPDTSADNPILTKLPLPDPSAGDDPNTALLQAAFMAGAEASNAVAEGDIKPRFIPIIRFYTTRSSAKLSMYLREHSSELKLNYRHWRGKHCFSLGSTSLPKFKTNEEASAFEEGFRSVLPDTVVWGEPPSNGG